MFACYRGNPDGTGFRLGALQVLTLRGGRIVEMTGLLDPEVHVRFGLPEELPREDRPAHVAGFLGVDR